MINPAMLHQALMQAAPQGAPSPQGGGTHPAIFYLKNAMTALRQYEQNETDPEDKAIAAKVYALLVQLMAKDQKEKDAAMGASPATKFLRNSSSGGPTA